MKQMNVLRAYYAVLRALVVLNITGALPVAAGAVLTVVGKYLYTKFGIIGVVLELVAVGIIAVADDIVALAERADIIATPNVVTADETE